VLADCISIFVIGQTAGTSVFNMALRNGLFMFADNCYLSTTHIFWPDIATFL